MPNKNLNDSRIPAWFSLGKYEKASGSSLVDWAFNLELRAGFFRTFANKENRAELLSHRMKEWGLLTELGFVSREYFSDRYEEEKRDVLRSMAHDGGHGTGLVYGLPLYRAHDIYTFIDWDSEFRQKITESLEGFRQQRLDTPANKEKDLMEWYQSEFQNRSFDSLYGEYESYCPAVCVDLIAPDEMIVAAFKKWLAATRKSNEETHHLGGPDVAPKKFSERSIARWHKASILPYLDLKIYEQISGKKIPLHVVGNAIFPSTDDIDTTESVRKTTKPLADIALQQHYFITRQAIIEEELQYKTGMNF